MGDLERVARLDERIAKIKEVGKWHFRHFSVRQIAEKTGLAPMTVQKYIAIIKDRMQNNTDIDVWIRDVVSRTMEEIDRISEQEMKLYEILDWAMTPVPDMISKDEQHVDPDGKPMMKPRSAGYVTQVTGQLGVLQRQRAELLKLIGNKTDITVNLQFAQKTQVLIMEKLKELDPHKYGELRRELEVMAAQFEKANGNKALAAPSEIVEGAYEAAGEFVDAAE